MKLLGEFSANHSSLKQPHAKRMYAYALNLYYL